MTSGKFATTLGYERRYNPALNYHEREAFVAYMNEGQPSRPANVENIVRINQGKLPLALALPHIPPISPHEATEWLQAGNVIVDARSPAEFGVAHVPGAINIQFSSPEFEQRVGWVLDSGQKFVLILEDDRLATRAVRKLAFIGMENRVAGFLERGMQAWMEAGLQVQSLQQITVEQLSKLLALGEINVLDVRETSEWDEGHIEGAQAMSYKVLREGVDALGLSPGDPIAVVCAGGYRSSTAASILLQKGFGQVLNVTGGMGAWKSAHLPMLDGQGNVCRI